MATKNDIDTGAPLTNGQLLIGSGSGRPIPGTVTDSASITASEGANSITLASATALGLHFISTQVASNDATIDFDNALTSTYDQYVFFLDGVTPATDDVFFKMLVGTGATPTYQVTNYAWTGFSDYAETLVADASDTEMVINFNETGAGENLGSAAGEGVYGGMIWLTGTQSGVLTQIRCMTSFIGDANENMFTEGVASWMDATVVTSVRFLMESGNVESGRFTLCGMSNS